MRAIVPADIPYRQRALDAEAVDTLTRACLTVAHRKCYPQTQTRDYIRQRWGSGDEARSVDILLKAASAPAMTSTTGWAKELATVTQAFLRNLTPMSAGADVLQRALGLSFNGAAAINLPKVVAPLCDFVAENASIPVVQAASDIQATLSPFKFAVITVLTRELVESSNGEVLIRQALFESTGPALDRRLFDANPAVADLRPAGLLYNITPLTPSASPSDKTDGLISDLQLLLSAVAVTAGNSPIVLVAAPAQAVAIVLRTLGTFPYSVLASSALPAGTVLAIAVNTIVSAAGEGPQIGTAEAASVTMDDAPSGAFLTGGSRVYANFQTDSVALRLRWPISWAVRDTRGIAVMNGVAW